MNDFEWDENEAPLAFLITFRTYGTWLHGDNRGAMDRHGQNVYGSPRVAINEQLENIMRDNRAGAAMILSRTQRDIIAESIKTTCKLRRYSLSAMNVRTNHAHIVASSPVKPEQMIIAFKANATRWLREAGLITSREKVWARGGSRRYLWKPSHVNGAIDYVLYGQGDDTPPYW